MIFTKTREGAKVPSREANYLEFELDSSDISVGNKVPYGSTTLKQTEKGVWYPNIQAAIDDVRAMMPSNLNEVYSCTDGISPAPAKQLTRVNFTGVCQMTADTPDTILEILGVPIQMVDGETAAQVAIKFTAKVEALVADNIAVDKVLNSSSSQNIVDITHIDYQNHKFEDITWNGITVSFSVLSPAKAGYGAWALMGSEDKTFDSTVVRFYYFQRTA